MTTILLPLIIALFQAAATSPCVCCPEDVPVPVVQLPTHGRIEVLVLYEGTPLPGVVVSIGTENGILLAVADKDGKIELPNVAPGGPYVAVAELDGLKKRKIKKVVVRAGQITRLQFRMRLGPNATCIDCGNAEPKPLDGPGFVVTREMIDRLPL